MRLRSLQIQYLPLPRPLCCLYPGVSITFTQESVTFTQTSVTFTRVFLSLLPRVSVTFTWSVTFSQLCLTESRTNIENIPGLLRRINLPRNQDLAPSWWVEGLQARQDVPGRAMWVC